MWGTHTHRYTGKYKKRASEKRLQEFEEMCQGLNMKMASFYVLQSLPRSHLSSNCKLRCHIMLFPLFNRIVFNPQTKPKT